MTKIEAFDSRQMTTTRAGWGKVERVQGKVAELGPCKCRTAFQDFVTGNEVAVVNYSWS